MLTFYRFNCINNFVTMMADVAQLVRALVCGTRCREFESLHPPHIEKTRRMASFFIGWRIQIWTLGKRVRHQRKADGSTPVALRRWAQVHGATRNNLFIRPILKRLVAWRAFWLYKINYEIISQNQMQFHQTKGAQQLFHSTARLQSVKLGNR